MPVGQLAHLDMSELISMPCWLGVGDLGHSTTGTHLQAAQGSSYRARRLRPHLPGDTSRLLLRLLPLSLHAQQCSCCAGMLLVADPASPKSRINLLIRRKARMSASNRRGCYPELAVLLRLCCRCEGDRNNSHRFCSHIRKMCQRRASGAVVVTSRSVSKNLKLGLLKQTAPRVHMQTISRQFFALKPDLFLYANLLRLGRLVSR